MKLNRIIMILGLAGLILSGCSEEESKSKKEAQLDKLSQTWELTSAKLNGVDVEGYESFELTLSGAASSSVYAYGVVGRPEVSPWLSGGTWVFGSEISTQLVRDPGTVDELNINYAVTSTTLEIDFQFSGEGYTASKVNSAEGHWEYTFTVK